MALVRTTIIRLQVRTVGGAGGIEEGEIRIFFGECFEYLRLPERCAKYDVVALLNIPLCRWAHRGVILAYAVDVRNFHIERGFHLDAGFFEGLLPAAVVLDGEIEPRRLRLVLQRK